MYIYFIYKKETLFHYEPAERPNLSTERHENLQGYSFIPAEGLSGGLFCIYNIREHMRYFNK